MGAVKRGLAEAAVLKPSCARRVPARVRRQPAERPAAWYGSTPEWQGWLERELVRQHPGQVTVASHDPGCFGPGGTRLRVYTHSGLYVPGQVERVPVRIEFHERPTYDTYGLPPQDYPRG